MTTSITVSANSAQRAFLATADEEKIFQLSKTDLEFLATGATGANLSVKFRLIEEFNEDAGFTLEIRKSDANGTLLSEVSSADIASFSDEGELDLDFNVKDDAPYYLIVRPSSADAYSEAQFEILFDEIPTFGGLVADSSVSSEDIIAQEDAYIGTDLKNTADFASTSDKVAFLIDLKSTLQDREMEISYSGPSTTVEVFKLSDAESASTKNITNAAGSTGITQTIGLIYTVTEADNKLTISRADGKQFTATFAIGDNAGVTSIPDPATSSTASGVSSVTFASALAGEAATGDTITLTLSSENETNVSRTFTATGATQANLWVDQFVDLFSEDSVTFTANAAAETIKVVFSSPTSSGAFDFSINASDNPSATEQQNLASNASLSGDQSHAPILRINDTASSDFKMSQKVGAVISSNVTFTSGVDYALADFLVVDGDYDAIYLTLEKVAPENVAPALSISMGSSSIAISTDAANPTILSKSDFLASTFTAGSSGTTGYNVTAFARKLTGQNKSETFTVDSDVSTWFSTEPNQTDSSSILQATVNYLDTSISANILDGTKTAVASSSSILEGEQGFLQVNVADFIKANNLATDLSINVSGSTNDVSFVDPSTGVTSKSKTVVITGAQVEIPFWVVSDPDLVAKEAVALEIEVIGSGNTYGQKLSSLYLAPAGFNVSELIPSLSTRYTKANALQPNDANSVFKYEISLDNYSDLKTIDDSILIKPIATSNASKFQTEAYVLNYDVDASEVSIGLYTGNATLTAKVFIDNVESAGLYSNGSISTTSLESSNVKLELSASGLPTAVYEFDAPASGATEANWSTALESAFKGFKFEAAQSDTASQVEFSVYSKAAADDGKASTLIEHELTYNGKTFDSVDLSMPNVQVTTNLATTDTWTPSGTDFEDIFDLNVSAANVKAGLGNDELLVSTIPSAKTSSFDGGTGDDTVTFGNALGQYKTELSSSGDVTVTEIASSGILYLKNTEKLSFGGETYELTRVDGSLSSYTKSSGNDLYVISTNVPSVTDTGLTGQDIIITTAPYISSNYQGIEEVYLSGDDNLKATLSSATVLHGNTGNNEIVLSSEDDIIYESAGFDSVTDSHGDDVDTFVLSDAKSSYTYYYVNDRHFITSSQGTSTLSNVEKIAYANDLGTSELISGLTNTAPSSAENLSGISVSISGDYVEGSTLTATFVDASNSQSIASSESFSWYEVGSSAALHTGSTLTLTAGDIGKTIYAEVSYLDSVGTLRTATSAETPVDYLDDPTTGIVTLVGSAKVGGKITPDVLSFSDLDFSGSGIPSISSYQWYRNGELLSGATERELEITQALNNETLSVKLGFLNSYGDIEYLTSSDSRLIFEGSDSAALSVSSNEFFVINSGSATVDATSGSIKSEFTSFFSGEEVSQYEDSIRTILALGNAYDLLNIDLKTSSSVISDPNTAQKFTVLGNEQTNKNLAAFLDMSGAAPGSKVEAQATQNIFLKGAVNISTDGSGHAIFLDDAAQVIVAGAGNDAIFSGAGDDTISAGQGLNTINAGTGSDTVNLEFQYNDSFLAYDSSAGAVLYNDGVHATTITGAEIFNFSDLTKTLAELSNLSNKNFSALGGISLIGAARSGAQLEIVDDTFESNGVELSSIAYEWLRDGSIIDGATSKTYTLTDVDIGSEISAKMSFDDNLGNSSVFVSSTLTNIRSERTDRAGTSGDDTFTSKSENELFSGRAGADTFKFKRKETVSQGDDAITDYDPLEDSIEFSDYDYTKITRSLDANGFDFFVFQEDTGESTLTVENEIKLSSLRLKNFKGGSLELTDKVISSNSDGLLNVSQEVSFENAKVSGVTDFSKHLKIAGEELPSDPITLSDVIAQLKHYLDLKPLKGNALAAGDTNNDGDVTLTDVIETLKHYLDLKKINSFDLVSDNEFVVNNLQADSAGNLTVVINGDADQSHADWEIVS